MDDVQKSLIEAIEILVDEEIKKTEFTTSCIGKVKEINGFDCTVEAYGEKMKCKLVEHLHGLIKVNDIVLVQDLQNNEVNKFIVCKVGGTT